MARFRQDYRLTEPQDRNQLRIHQFLAGKGYITQQYWGMTVFCKGSASLGNETMVQITYPEGMVRVEAWLKSRSLSGGVTELGIEGYYGIALKGELKRVTVELDSLLGGPANRIGYNSHLLGKNAAPMQAPAVKFQPVQPQQPQFQTAPQQPPIQSQVAPPAPEQEVLDVNSCSEMQLLQLPGVNVVLAKKAVEYRTANGGFRSADEFVEVLQLKPHFAAQILPRITTCDPRESQPADDGAAFRRKFDI